MNKALEEKIEEGHETMIFRARTSGYHLFTLHDHKSLVSLEKGEPIEVPKDCGITDPRDRILQKENEEELPS